MTSSIYAPEIVNHQGLEVPFDGIEHKQEELEHLPNSTLIVPDNDLPSTQNDVRVAQKRWSSLRDRRLLLVGLAAAIIASVVIGAVIGTRKLQHARYVPYRQFICQITNIYSKSSPYSIELARSENRH